VKVAADRHVSSYLFVEIHDCCSSNLGRNASNKFINLTHTHMKKL
jgi:hypothetical protein